MGENDAQGDRHLLRLSQPGGDGTFSASIQNAASLAFMTNKVECPYITSQLFFDKVNIFNAESLSHWRPGHNLTVLQGISSFLDSACSTGHQSVSLVLFVPMDAMLSKATCSWSSWLPFHLNRDFRVFISPASLVLYAYLVYKFLSCDGNPLTSPQGILRHLHPFLQSGFSWGLIELIYNDLFLH